ncbi:hypothetical protein KR026_010846, partial [Drosophila bipectinata]
RVDAFLHRMQDLIIFLTVFFLCPVVLFFIFKFALLAPFLGIDNSNAAIGSAVATVIVMHVLIAGYTLRLIFVQEFSRMETLEVWAEWVPPQAQKHGPILIVLLLMSYCSLIIGFPIATFFALKFVVLTSFEHMDADVISAICTVLAVHTAVGIYIYRATYAKNSTAKGGKDNQ